MNRLGNMRPCTGYCQMIGAAAALLSIKGIQVIFNSPRWCAVIGERELMNAVKDYQERLFCSEARQKDILYQPVLLKPWQIECQSSWQF